MAGVTRIQDISHRLRRLTAERSPTATLAVAAGLFLTISGTPAGDHLEQIQDRGSLVVLTRNGASSYYTGPDGPTGFEYTLARRFASFIGVELELKLVGEVGGLIPELRAGRGDLIAAGLAITPKRQTQIRFGPVYQEAVPLVVYRRGARRPRNIGDLIGGKLAVLAGSSYIRRLRGARELYPELEWEEVANVGIEALLESIDEGRIDYTVIDSTAFALNRPFYPGVVKAFDLGVPDRIAWGFGAGDDDSLVQQARLFFHYLELTGELTAIRSRFYEHFEGYNHVATYDYLRAIRERLPSLRPLFVKAAGRNALDWHLLAAVGYQESHWKPRATSPTGVRGIMMLTLPTARQLGVANRLDPAQSIAGGARYLRRMIDRIPATVEHPDRVWMALAAYNIGYQHLMDARVLTRRQGGDPDRWGDVKERLPLLSRRNHYTTLDHGYARGWMAVRYVENIRIYHSILTWLDQREHPLIADAAGPETTT